MKVLKKLTGNTEEEEVPEVEIFDCFSVYIGKISLTT